MNKYKIFTPGGIAVVCLYDPIFGTTAWKEDAMSTQEGTPGHLYHEGNNHQHVTAMQAYTLSTLPANMCNSNNNQPRIWGYFATGGPLYGQSKVRLNKNDGWLNFGYDYAQWPERDVPGVLSKVKVKALNGNIVTLIAPPVRNQVQVTNAKFNADGSLDIGNGKRGYLWKNWGERTINVSLPSVCGVNKSLWEPTCASNQDTFGCASMSSAPVHWYCRDGELLYQIAVGTPVYTGTCYTTY